MSPLRRKVYKGRSCGETSGKEPGTKHERCIHRQAKRKLETQKLEKLRKERELELQVKSFYILQIFITANQLAGRKNYCLTIAFS